MHALAAEGDVPPDTVRDADDFVHLLLGLASIGKSIERLAESAVPRSHSVTVSPLSVSTTSEVAAMTAMLAGSDFLRTPVLATALPDGFKEWHHFVIHGAGRRLLINFSLSSEPSRTGQLRLAPRVIVIDHEKRWTGAIERFDESDLDISADLGTLTIGRQPDDRAARRLPGRDRPPRARHSG